MFKVVEFTDNGLGVVREEWLTPRKRECLWPPFKTTSRFNKCLTAQLPPDETWPAYAVKRVMFETNDLQLAREKCKKAESESELLSEEDTSKKKRKRKIILASDSDEGEADEEERILNYPSPPNGKSRRDTPLAKEKIRHQQQPEYRASTPPSITCSSITSPKHRRMEKEIKSDARESRPIARNYSAARILLQNFNVDSPLSSPSSPHSATRTEAKPSSLDQINASLALIATYIADIQSEVKEIKATQNDILLRLSFTTPGKINLPDEIALPLKSIEDLNNIQIWLEDEENKQNLINNLSFVGGNTTATITRRILQRVFSSSLALKCNWTGKNEKFSLKKIQLTEVIINAVRRNKLTERATDAEITNALTSWFRFARDRNGGREDRRATAKS